MSHAKPTGSDRCLLLIAFVAFCGLCGCAQSQRFVCLRSCEGMLLEWAGFPELQVQLQRLALELCEERLRLQIQGLWWLLVLGLMECALSITFYILSILSVLFEKRQRLEFLQTLCRYGNHLITSSARLMKWDRRCLAELGNSRTSAYVATRYVSDDEESSQAS